MEVEVGKSVYSAVPSVCFTFKRDELIEAGITEQMLIEDSNEKVIAFLSDNIGAIGSEYQLLCKCDSNYDEVLYSGLSEEEYGVKYFVNSEYEDEVTLCVTIPVQITVVDYGVNIGYIL